jgi:pimeloyl-ACP methyl ester carboxylesterase
VLPRYQLCHLSAYSDFQHDWRFSSPSKFPTAEMLFYSSHGDLHNLTSAASDIRKVIIVIHGQGRNADDYFCSASAVVSLQNIYRTDQVLLLAPRFVFPADLPFSRDLLQTTVLQWNGTDAYGPWRYGANAIAPRTAQNVSSFDVIDAMVETLRVLLPHRPPITLAGHSSGGQFVQRWALASNEAQHVQAVVANPSSYAYLTPQRYDAAMGEWRVLNDHDNCSDYNQWEWGLDVTNETPDYVQRLLQNFTHLELIQRFATRHIVYMIGSLDRCNVSSLGNVQDSGTTKARATPWWCNSHGLETTCMDQWQGSHRWERNQRYMDMLHRVLTINNSTHYHVRVEVPGVGHDHSLMFSSPQGLNVLFSPKQQANGNLELTMVLSAA